MLTTQVTPEDQKPAASSKQMTAGKQEPLEIRTMLNCANINSNCLMKSLGDSKTQVL